MKTVTDSTGRVIPSWYRNELFALGREIAWALPATLRPTREQMKDAAAKLSVTQSHAWRAWDEFTHGHTDR